MLNNHTWLVTTVLDSADVEHSFIAERSIGLGDQMI